MRKLTNSALVERCIKGDRLIWDKFVERFSGLIFWAIKERLNRSNLYYNQQDIEDIFQNVFVLLWQKDKLRQIRNREKISGWLSIVSANCAINYFRKKKEKHFNNKTLNEQSIRLGCSTNCSIINGYDQEMKNAVLDMAIKSLSARERIILKLNYLHGKTHQEIAKILKTPTNTISSIIKRSKGKLKGILEKEGFR